MKLIAYMQNRDVARHMDRVVSTLVKRSEMIQSYEYKSKEVEAEKETKYCSLHDPSLT